MSRINCHSAFRHYEMFHGHGACGGGSYGSIFNTTYNINCGGHHGGFWGGFGLGLGNFVGNLFGGFMGNMGFGGFGFGSGMGFGFPGFGFGGFNGANLFGGSNLFGDNWLGGSKSNRTSTLNSSKTTSCNCKGCKDNDNKTKEVIKDDPDCAKIADLAKKANLANDENAINNLIEDIDNAIKALDDNNKEAQTKTLNELKKGLEAKKTGLDKNKVQTPVTTSSTPPVAPNSEPAQVNEDAVTVNRQPVKLSDLTPEEVKALNDNGALTPEQLAKLTDTQKALLNPVQDNNAANGDDSDWTNLEWDDDRTIPNNFTTPNGYADVDNDDAKNITAENLKRTHDTGKPIDVVNNNGAKISNAKYNGTNFPLYLQITDSKAHNYKCIGTDGSGRAYYTTPNSDTNNNVYVLVKKDNEYVLYQDDKLSGQNKGDLQ